MSGCVYDHDGEPRYFGLYFAFVVENVDPEKMGRVRITIPGMIEPASGWAWPIAMGGGSPQSGAWDIPKKGAGVAVMFHQGDPDEPVYFHGWYANNHLPTPARDASADDAANKIKCFESDQHLVVLDGVKGQVLVKDKNSGNVIVMTGDKVFLGGDENALNPAQHSLVLASTPCQFTGAPHMASGKTSLKVFAKDE
jgi:hypothetical protein